MYKGASEPRGVSPAQRHGRLIPLAFQSRGKTSVFVQEDSMCCVFVLQCWGWNPGPHAC